MECHLKIQRILTWAPMRNLICKQTGCLKLYWANGLLYIIVPHLIWGVPETQRIYLKAVKTRIEVHQGFHILWPLHLDNAHQPHSLQQCHGHPKSDGGAQQCGGLVKADSPAGTGAYRQWKSENTFFGPHYISFGPGHFYWTLLHFFCRWLPFFWTCTPSFWTSSFPPARPGPNHTLFG